MKSLDYELGLDKENNSLDSYSNLYGRMNCRGNCKFMFPSDKSLEKICDNMCNGKCRLRSKCKKKSDYPTRAEVCQNAGLPSDCRFSSPPVNNNEGSSGGSDEWVDPNADIDLKSGYTDNGNNGSDGSSGSAGSSDSTNKALKYTGVGLGLLALIIGGVVVVRNMSK